MESNFFKNVCLQYIYILCIYIYDTHSHTHKYITNAKVEEPRHCKLGVRRQDEEQQKRRGCGLEPPIPTFGTRADGAVSDPRGHFPSRGLRQVLQPDVLSLP